MSWKYFVGIAVIMNSCVLILSKIVSDKLNQKSIGIFYQSFFCSLMAITYFIFKEKDSLSISIVLAGLIGFMVVFGIYFQWRALELSLSKTVLFLPLVNVVPVILATLFLGEIKFWDIQSTSGIILCFLAMWFFRLSSNNLNKIKKNPNKKWFLFTLAMIIILGLAVFFMKLSSKNVARETFLIGWYLGSFISSLIILKIEKQKIILIPGKIILLIMILSFSIIGNLFALYQSFELNGPVSLIMPLHGLGITIIPVFFGWFVFKERKGLYLKEWLGFFVGISGALLVLFT